MNFISPLILSRPYCILVLHLIVLLLSKEEMILHKLRRILCAYVLLLGNICIDFAGLICPAYCMREYCHETEFLPEILFNLVLPEYKLDS